MKEINIYDFDGTIYGGDSSIDFWKFCIKKKPIILKWIPIQVTALILNKFNILNTTKFKSIFFTFLKDFNELEIENNIDLFWQSKKNKFEKWFVNREKHCYEIVISASPYFLLNKICRFYQIDKIIATEMDYNGQIHGENCKGEQKVVRLNQNIDDYIINEFYSDCISDLPLAKLSKTAFIIKNGKKEKWEIQS